MKRIVMLVSALTILIGTAHAETTISNNIITDTTWTLAGSPYLVTKSIDVYPNVKLAIEAGVVVKFEVASDIDIYGELMAIGSPSAKIVFTIKNITTTPTYWNGLNFKVGAMGTIVDANGNYLNGSLIRYCQISYSEGVVSAVDLYITDCEFLFAGINVSGNSRVENNRFSHGMQNRPAVVNSGSSYIGKNVFTGSYSNVLAENSFGLVINSSGNNTKIENNLFSDLNVWAKCRWLAGGVIGCRGEGTSINSNTFTNNVINFWYGFDTLAICGAMIASTSDGQSIVNIVGNKILGNRADFAFYSDRIYMSGWAICSNNSYNSVTIANNEIVGNLFFASAYSLPGVNGAIEATTVGAATNKAIIVGNNIDRNSGDKQLSYETVGGIKVKGKHFTVSNNRVTNNLGNGIRVESNGTVEVAENHISANTGAGIALDTTYYSYDLPQAVLRDNIVTENSEGIHTGAGGLVSGNSVTNNRGNGIYSADAPAQITANRVHTNGGVGIRAYSATVDGNKIYDNVSGGIWIEGSGEITRNLIGKNSVYGLLISSSANVPLVTENKICGNLGFGLQAPHIDSFTENDVYGNDVYDLIYTGSLDQLALNNYWGTVKSAEIKNKIYDYWDEIALGEVIYEPFSTTAYYNTVAKFQANPSVGQPPLRVAFTDQSSGGVVSWLWDFGDQDTSTDQNPIHVFKNEGTFTVTLAVTDLYGFKGYTSSRITVRLSRGMPWLLLLLQD